jgi:Spy/CpxP family protein refolding chaperone
VSGWRGLAVTVVLTLAAAFIGAWAGATYLGPARGGGASLHETVHAELDLSPAQDARLDEIEARFAVRRRQLELEIQSANAELAAAIQAEGRNGPQVAAAIDHFHDTMGRLQKLTVEHVFAMRGVLTPAQAAEFDRTVVRALTAEAR